MTSPGLLQLSVNAFSIAAGAPAGPTAIVWDPHAVVNAAPMPAMGVQNCIIEFPWYPGMPVLQPQPVQHTHYHFTPLPAVPAPLSDSDVERIARRVAELLREPK